MHSPPGDQKENPESWSDEIGVQGIEALPKRIDKYGKAKKSALDVADYMVSLPEYKATAERLAQCGDYLVFRHYWTVDKVRLHGARLCMKHLLCQLCAIRRGAKALRAYADRYKVIKAEKPHLRPFLVTLTVKDGPDLEERFKHLYKAQKELWQQKHRIYASPFDTIEGAVWSYEIKRGTGSGEWHPHLHMIALAEHQPQHAWLSDVWHKITGDSFIVHVTPINEDDHIGGFMEVFKYAVKFSDQPPADTVHAWQTLGGKRLLGSSGAFRGVVVPHELTDDAEGFEDLPYVTLFYRYLAGRGYSLKTI